jgi:hypothetical protein
VQASSRWGVAMLDGWIDLYFFLKSLASE